MVVGKKEIRTFSFVFSLVVAQRLAWGRLGDFRSAKTQNFQLGLLLGLDFSFRVARLKEGSVGRASDGRQTNLKTQNSNPSVYAADGE